jgi:hypothetical protein
MFICHTYRMWYSLLCYILPLCRGEYLPMGSFLAREPSSTWWETTRIGRHPSLTTNEISVLKPEWETIRIVVSKIFPENGLLLTFSK